jgi:regulator of sigma E protease
LAEILSHPIPAVIILLGVLVLVHELGHYLVGRWCGIAVDMFSIGFGPPIVRFMHKGTDYRIAWIPLGGFVKFAGSNPYGDDDMHEAPGREKPPGIGLLQASLPKRALTIAAGPFANFLLAVAVYTVLGFQGIQHPPAVIGEVIAGSAAESAGIRYGDRFVAIDGKEIKTWRDLESIIATSPGKTLSVTLERDGAVRQVQLTPAEVEGQDMTGRPAKIGRAGVALGRLPAIVTVTAADTPAALAGIVTGDRVKAVYSGQTLEPIAFYNDLAAALVREAERGAASVDIDVEAAQIPHLSSDEGAPAPAPEQKPTRRVSLSLAGLSSATGEPVARIRAALGLADSQLTVAVATETVASTLKRGDMFVAWNGHTVDNVYKLREQLIAQTTAVANVTVVRDQARQDVTLTLKAYEAQRPEGVVTIYGLPALFWGQPEEPEPVIEQYRNPIMALAYGVKETGVQTGVLFANVMSLVSGDVPLKALGGPMLIAKVAGDSARRGLQTFLSSMALISINLGVLNLFPIPVLDGGQLILIGAEAVRRRPLRATAVENFQKVGFAMILALVVLATYNDLSRFWKSMLESVVGVFQ